MQRDKMGQKGQTKTIKKTITPTLPQRYAQNGETKNKRKGSTKDPPEDFDPQSLSYLHHEHLSCSLKILIPRYCCCRRSQYSRETQVKAMWETRFLYSDYCSLCNSSQHHSPEEYDAEADIGRNPSQRYCY
jgi:hypothetical protein